ncbi:hypothetical protein ACWKWK_04720 [Pseudoxanthomonas beigongshangi]
MKIKVWLLAGLMAPWIPAALAQQTPHVNIEQRLTPEQMRATGLEQLTPTQLELLNRLLAEQVEARAQERAKVIARSQPPVGPRDEGSLIGLNDEPIRARLKGTVAGWEPGTVFELDNGQQWKVLKGRMKLSRPLESPDIVVVPGVAGRWFLQVEEDTPKARVYRID